MGNRIGDIKKQQCEINERLTRKHRKRRRMEETIAML